MKLAGSPPFLRRPGFRRGFTIVELLVSMAILVLLLVLIAKLMDSATLTTTSSRKHMDADSQARLVFDRMANDFAKMVRRPDVDYIFSKYPATPSVTGSNDTMFFYSEAPAYASASVTAANRSSVALVGYRIETSGSTPYQLERLGKDLTWDGATGNTSGTTVPGGMVFLTFGTSGTPGSLVDASTMANNWSGTIGKPTDTPPYSSGKDPAYHVLADSVFRMEFCFQVKDVRNASMTGVAYSDYPVAYTNQTNPASGTVPTSPNAGDRWYDTSNNRTFICSSVNNGAASWQPLGMSDVSGIVVALAILDTSSQRILLQNAVLPSGTASKMIGAFGDSNLTSASTKPALIAPTWQGKVNSFGFAGTVGMPQVAASQIRIYQRLFSLNNQ